MQWFLHNISRIKKIIYFHYQCSLPTLTPSASSVKIHFHILDLSDYPFFKQTYQLDSLLNLIRFFFHGVWNWEVNNGGPKPLPLWTVPIHLILSLIFGILITIFIEEPARKKLKKWQEKQSEKEIQTENAKLLPK